MKKSMYVFLLLVLSVQFNYGQDIYDTITDELCTCAKERNIKSIDEIEPCFETVVFKNINALLEFHEVELMSELDDNVFDKIGIKFTKDCDYAFDLVPDTVKTEIPETITSDALRCTDARSGDFYYVQPAELGSTVMDTTYVSFSGQRYLERMKGGKTYSLLELTWKSDCAFDLTFIESNDPYKKNLSDVGDVYSYEIVSATKNSLFLKLIYKDNEFHIEMVKMTP